MKKINTDITAFILSGGKSSRIGTNKSLLEIDGKSLIHSLVELLDALFSNVVISSNEPYMYEFAGKKVIQDIFPDRGPLSGIHSSLQSSNTERNFFISCDMPFITPDVINFLCAYKSDSSVILPKTEGRIQLLCGLYSKRILPEVNSLLEDVNQKVSNLKGSMFELLDRVDKDIIDVIDMDFYHTDLFFNINTPEDYNYAKRILERK